MIKTVLDAFDKDLITVDDSELVTLNKERKQVTLDLWSHYVLLMESLNEKQVL